MITGTTTLELEYPDFVLRFASPRGWRVTWFRTAALPPAPAVRIAPVVEIGVSPVAAWGLLPPAYPQGAPANAAGYDEAWTRGPVPILTPDGGTLPEGTSIYRVHGPSPLSNDDLGELCSAWLRAGRPDEVPTDIAEIMRRLPQLRVRQGGGAATTKK